MNNFISSLSVFMLIWVMAACSYEKKVDVPDNEHSFSEVEIDSVTYSEDISPEEVKSSEIDLSNTQLQLSHMRSTGNWDNYNEGILPAMAEDAPEYCRQILESGDKRFIIVDKAKMRLFLYDRFGRVEKSYGIACAKNYGTKHKKGDSRTTEGIFKVKGIFDSTEWLFTDDNGYTSPAKGQYGPRFIRLNIPYIGIHGTASPGSIGKRCSHGCIRVTNPNILELVKYVEEGMPVIISPGPRDMAVNKKEGYEILSVATEPGSSPARPGWDSEKKPELPKEEMEDTVEFGTERNVPDESEQTPESFLQENIKEIIPDLKNSEEETIENIQE